MLVRYDVVGAPLWHQRLILAASARPGWYAVLTPTRDMFMEELSLQNDDIVGIRTIKGIDDVPWGVPAQRIFGFQSLPSQEATTGLLRDGEVLAFGHGGPKPRPVAVPGPAGGALVPTGTPAGPPPSGPPSLGHLAGAPAAIPSEIGVLSADPVAEGDNVWELQEDAGNFKKGDRMPLPSGAVGDCRIALAPLLGNGPGSPLMLFKAVDPKATPRTSASSSSAAPVEDARTLPVLFDAQGLRSRPFAEAVSLMTEDSLPGGFDLQGPRTALPLLKSMVGLGGSPEASHLEWVRNSKVPDGDRAVYEDEVICVAL